MSTPTATSLRIDGPLVIATVVDWHRRCVEYLQTATAPVLDLGGVTAVDVFGLQLLLAAHRSATARGQHLTLTAAPALLDDACAAAGLARSSLFTLPA